jgi:hypothetical protein
MLATDSEKFGSCPFTGFIRNYGLTGFCWFDRSVSVLTSQPHRSSLPQGDEPTTRRTPEELDQLTLPGAATLQLTFNALESIQDRVP